MHSYIAEINGWGQLWLSLKAWPKDTHLTQVIPKLRLFGSAEPLNLAEVDLTQCIQLQVMVMV